MIDLVLLWWVRARKSRATWNPLWTLIELHFALFRCYGRWPGISFYIRFPLSLFSFGFVLNGELFDIQAIGHSISWGLLPRINRKEGESGQLYSGDKTWPKVALELIKWQRKEVA